MSAVERDGTGWTPDQGRGRAAAGTTGRGPDPRGWGRETVESIVVAFTLALLFRAFEAEAFVIPTGSMAPTLMGRHKDLACESCGLPFRVGCSGEDDDDSRRLQGELARLEADGRDPGRTALVRRQLGAKLVERARCPNCGHGTPLTIPRGVDRVADPRYPSFNGDRILVDKFAYDVAPPARWDVVVFKYPEEAKTNYIKRLVGLPGETVTIAGGDIWTSRGDAEPVIARKPPGTLRAMLQLVHDSRYVSPELVAAGWPPAWTDWSPPDAADRCRWTSDDDGRSFTVACAAREAATVRFRHMIPTADAWARLARDGRIDGPPRPDVIRDIQPYNPGPEGRGHRWVGDLGVEVDVESRAAGGTLTFDLVEAGRRHSIALDLGGGTAVASWPGAVEKAVASTPVRGAGSWRVLVANVDDSLALFIDGRAVAFDRPATWRRSLDDATAARPVPRGAEPGDTEAGDLAPIGITAVGATVRLRRLQVLADTYYIASRELEVFRGGRPELERFSASLDDGQYFMLGDNSSASKDGRAWDRVHYVDRHLITGRALLVFWPHAVPASWAVPLRFRGLEVRLPSWPNFARMRFVR
jgi:signal peptidase I